MDKVYIVMEEYRARSVDEITYPKHTCATRELAEKRISELKESIKNTWKDKIDFNDGWEEEVDEPDHYTLADTVDYEHYYEVIIVEMPVEKE